MNYKAVVEGKNGIVARIVADSVSEAGNRITTFELEYHRYIHSEIMTHRCLVGDTELYFDLPSGQDKSKYRLYKKTIKEFYNQWTDGSSERKPSKWIEKNIEKIESNKKYTAKELSDIVGYSSASTVRTNCRNGRILVQNKDKSKQEDFIILGSDFIKYCDSAIKALTPYHDEYKAKYIELQKQCELLQSEISNLNATGENDLRNYIDLVETSI